MNIERNEKFEEAVESMLLHDNITDTFLASDSVHGIYDYVVELSEPLLDEEYFMENYESACETLFKIQQILNSRPMDLFLFSLSEDPHFGIRVAAKGNLAERIGGPVDNEVILMANSNFTVVSEIDRLLNELWANQVLNALREQWRKSIRGPIPADYNQ